MKLDGLSYKSEYPYNAELKAILLQLLETPQSMGAIMRMEYYDKSKVSDHINALIFEGLIRCVTSPVFVNGKRLLASVNAPKYVLQTRQMVKGIPSGQFGTNTPRHTANRMCEHCEKPMDKPYWNQKYHKGCQRKVHKVQVRAARLAREKLNKGG